MKKTTAFLTVLALVLSLFLLPGCSPKTEGNPLPEGMNETQLLDAGREVRQLLLDKQYQEVVDRMRADIVEKGGITAKAVEDIMAPTIEKSGDFVGETEAMTTGQKDKDSGEEYGVAVFMCKHDKKNVRYRLAFDTDMVLIGLQIRKV